MSDINHLGPRYPPNRLSRASPDFSPHPAATTDPLGLAGCLCASHPAPRKVGMPLTSLTPLPPPLVLMLVDQRRRIVVAGVKSIRTSRKVKEIRHKKTVKFYLAPGFHAGMRDALLFHERYDGSPHEEYKPFSSLCDPPGE